MKISFRNQCLHYQLIGNGPRWVIAFHGYGESGSAFHSLATEMSMDCTFICPDLPLHGKSIWELATPFTPSELEEIIRLLMQEHGFNSLVLAGYSMGGRLVSSLLTKSKLPIEEVWLFAPDGFHRNPWYWLATQTAWGNRLFKFTMQQPNWLLKAMKIAKTLNLLHPGIYKFSIQFLMQEKARKDLYERWTFYKNFKVNQEELKDQLIANRMHLRLFFGKFDRIIPPSHGRWIQEHNAAFTTTVLLQTGHRLLDPAITPNIAAAIRLPLHETGS